MKKEYYYTDEVAIIYSISTKTVSRRIKELTGENDSKLIVKKNGRWRIHSLALPKFKPRKKDDEFTALTIDPVINYNQDDLQSVIDYINDKVSSPLEFYYSIETKDKDGKPHVHAYLPTDQFKNYLKVLRSLVEVSYRATPIYDLEGWQNYIGKESTIIKYKK